MMEFQVVREPSSKNLLALEDTVQEYEQTIYNLENGHETISEVKNRWESYGLSCRLCVSVSEKVSLGQGGSCRWCVLRMDLKEDCNRGVMMKTAGELGFVLHHGNEKESGYDLLQILKARLAAILKRVDERGYQIK